VRDVEEILRTSSGEVQSYALEALGENARVETLVWFLDQAGRSGNSPFEGIPFAGALLAVQLLARAAPDLAARYASDLVDYHAYRCGGWPRCEEWPPLREAWLIEHPLIRESAAAAVERHRDLRTEALGANGGPALTELRHRALEEHAKAKDLLSRAKEELSLEDFPYINDLYWSYVYVLGLLASRGNASARTEIESFGSNLSLDDDLEAWDTFAFVDASRAWDVLRARLEKSTSESEADKCAFLLRYVAEWFPYHDRSDLGWYLEAVDRIEHPDLWHESPPDNINGLADTAALAYVRAMTEGAPAVGCLVDYFVALHAEAGSSLLDDTVTRLRASLAANEPALRADLERQAPIRLY
jgi:hypothetical protein